MGSIKEKLKQRLDEMKRERADNKAYNRYIHEQAKIAERQGYAKGRIERARIEGYRKGKTAKGSSGILGTLGRYAANFAEAGEDLAALPPSLTKKKKRKNDWMF